MRHDNHDKCDEFDGLMKSGSSDVCFSDYAREYQSKMIQEGHERNARTYELAFQHLERFMGTTQVMFSHLTSFVCCFMIPVKTLSLLVLYISAPSVHCGILLRRGVVGYPYGGIFAAIHAQAPYMLRHF